MITSRQAATRGLLLPAFLISVLAGALAGQANPDDLIVTTNSQTYLLAVDGKGTPKTFANVGLRAQCITEGLLNRGVLIGSQSLPGDLVHVSLTGVATTIVKAGPLVVDLDVDGEGNYLGAGFGPGGKSQNAVFTISPTGVITTLIQGGSPFGKIYAMALDTFSGDVVVFDGAGYILRITRDAKPIVTTIISGITTGGNGGLHPWYGGHGQLLGVWNQTAVHRLTLGGTKPVTTLKSGAPLVWLSDVEYDPASGQYLLVDLKNSQGSVYRFDPLTSAVTSVVNFTGIRPTQVAVAAGRHLSALGPARVGQTYQLKVSMPQHAGAFYLTALSFGFAPGIPLPGGVTVYLNPDALFFLSLSNPPIFTNFQGSLSATGEAAPAVAIPNVPLLAGLRFFAAAVAFNGAVPLRASEPLGFTIRP